MVLRMFIEGKLVDSSVLSLHKISDERERDWYIQGAVKDLLEKWEDLVQDQNLNVQFFISGDFRF